MFFEKQNTQFRLSSSKSTVTSTITSTTIGAQASVKPSRRSAKLSVAKAVAATTTKRKYQKQASTISISTASDTDDKLDDRMGENNYSGGKLLATDYFKNLKFSFERVPANEPWYLTFQRQDEHRERMFEYWGNTGKI